MALFKKNNKKEERQGSSNSAGSDHQNPVVGTLIEKSLRIKGTITGNDPVTVLGNFEGNCDLNSNLEVGETAFVKGQFNAENVVIRGKVEGEVTAAAKAHLDTTARVAGRMQAQKLSVSEGAVFDGELKMTTAAKPPQNGKKAGKK